MQSEERNTAGLAQRLQPAVKDGKITPLSGPVSVPVDDEISLLELWRILRRHKNIIFAATLLGIALPALAAWLMTPLYRAEVVVAPVTGKDDRHGLLGPLAELSGIAGLAGVSLSRGDRKNEAMAVLQSRLLTEQFIREQKLLPVLFPDRWVEGESDADDAAAGNAPTMYEAYTLFDEKIRRVYEDRKSGMVVLSIAWKDPQQAALWANRLIQQTNELLRQRSTEESKQAIHYLQEQIKQTSAVELQQVLHRVVESKLKEIILANVNEEFAFRIIDPAVAPEQPFKPVVPLMLTFGMLLGLIGGVVLAFVLNLVRPPENNSLPH